MIESTVWSYLLYISHSVMHWGCKIRWKSYIFDLSKNKFWILQKEGGPPKGVLSTRNCVLTHKICCLLTWSYQEYSRTTFRTAHLTLSNNQSINQSNNEPIKIGTRKLKNNLKCIMCFLLQIILTVWKNEENRKRKEKKTQLNNIYNCTLYIKSKLLYNCFIIIYLSPTYA
jgi:hypothetical protein